MASVRYTQHRILCASADQESFLEVPAALHCLCCFSASVVVSERPSIRNRTVLRTLAALNDVILPTAGGVAAWSREG